MQKRILSALIASLYFFFTGPAYALIPLIPGVVPLATYLGATATFATALDYSLVLHAAVLAIAFNKTSGPATSDTSAQLTVKLNPKDPLPTPTGWTAPVPPSIAPNPPSSATSAFSSYAPFGGITATGTTAEAAIRAGVIADNAYLLSVASALHYTVTSCVVSTSKCIVHNDRDNVNNDRTASVTCPTGYVVNSFSACILNNAATVVEPSNGNCQVIRTGNTFSGRSNDPDCSVSSPAMSGATVEPLVVTMMRADGAFVTTVINSDGSTTVTESYPDIANSKTNKLITTYSSPNPSTGLVELTGISTDSL